MPATEGKLSHIGIAGEKTWGTAVGAADYLKFSSESLSHTIEDLVEASLNGRRDEGASYEGLNSVAGDTVHETHPTNLGYFLRSFFGHPATVAHSATSYTHVFTPHSGVLASTEKGTATAGTGTTLTDSGKSWTVDSLIGKYVHIIGGTGKGQSRYITDNDATSVTVDTWVTTPDTTSVYELRNGPKDCSLCAPYTLEIHRNLAGATPAYQYAGCVVNAMAFSIGAGTKLLNLSNSWIGKSVTNIAHTTPTLPSTEPFKWNEMKFGFNRSVAATVDAGSTTTAIKCKSVSWTADAYIGDVVFIKTGTGINQARVITDNTADTLTVGTLVTGPAEDDTIEIFSAFDYAEEIGWTFDNGLVGVPLLNNSQAIGKIEGDGYRTGTLTGTFEDNDTTNYARFIGRTQVRACLYFEGATISGAHKHRLFIDMPYVLLDAYPHNVGGGGKITVGVSAKLKYDSTDARAFRVILDNNKANYNL